MIPRSHAHCLYNLKRGARGRTNLHSCDRRKIVYRDLKPENVAASEKGCSQIFRSFLIYWGNITPIMQNQMEKKLEI